MAVKFVRDSKGLQEYLNSPGVLEALHAFAGPIASHIAASKSVETEVVDYKAVPKGRFTERHAVAVRVIDFRARTWQVRDGLLTRAAAAQGLEVTER